MLNNFYIHFKNNYCFLGAIIGILLLHLHLWIYICGIFVTGQEKNKSSIVLITVGSFNKKQASTSKLNVKSQLVKHWPIVNSKQHHMLVNIFKWWLQYF